jgi:quercetin dioxygenase-like cupin family protein
MRNMLLVLVAVAALGAEPVRVTKIVWRDGPPTLPHGAKIAVLEGDPAKEGLFTMRIKLPAGTTIAPHWHPRDERVTVLSGHVMVGFGDVIDSSSTTDFTAGGFYVNPANSHHYLIVPKESVLQLTCVGPWELHPVE